MCQRMCRISMFVIELCTRIAASTRPAPLETQGEQRKRKSMHWTWSRLCHPICGSICSFFEGCSCCQVNGLKKWITCGMFADYFTTAVRTGGEGMFVSSLFCCCALMVQIMWLYLYLFLFLPFLMFFLLLLLFLLLLAGSVSSFNSKDNQGCQCSSYGLHGC